MYWTLTNFLDLNCLKIQMLLICFLLNARFLIYRHKYVKSKPTVAAFIRTIYYVKIIEKRIAKKNGKLKQHLKNGFLCMA